MRTAKQRQTTSQPPLLGLEQLVCFALYSTGLAMDKVYREALQPLNLTYPQYLVMLVLWASEGSEELNVTELGNRLFLDSATLTPLLKRLEHGGLLTRRRAADDERRVTISLTAAGDALRHKAKDVQLAVGRASQCSNDELGRLRDQLVALRAKLRKT